MIICGRLDPSFENVLIVVSSRLKENIDFLSFAAELSDLIWIINHEHFAQVIPNGWK